MFWISWPGWLGMHQDFKSKMVDSIPFRIGWDRMTETHLKLNREFCRAEKVWDLAPFFGQKKRSCLVLPPWTQVSWSLWNRKIMINVQYVYPSIHIYIYIYHIWSWQSIFFQFPKKNIRKSRTVREFSTFFDHVSRHVFLMILTEAAPSWKGGLWRYLPGQGPR